MRTVIAVDLNTMRELADEEVRVRSEKIDWCEAAYREEAVRRVEERREVQQMIEAREASRIRSLGDISGKAFRAAVQLDMARDLYSHKDAEHVRQLLETARDALIEVCKYARGEATR